MAMAAWIRRSIQVRTVVSLASHGVKVPKAIEERKLTRLVSKYAKRRVVYPRRNEPTAAFCSTFKNISQLMIFYLENGMTRRGLPDAFRVYPDLAKIVYEPQRFKQIMAVLRSIGDQTTVHKIVRSVPHIFIKRPAEIKRTIAALESLGVEKSLLAKRPVFLSLEDLEAKTEFLCDHGVSRKSFGKILKIWKGAADLSLDKLKLKIQFLVNFGVLGKNLERTLIKYPWFLKSDNTTMEHCCPLFKHYGLEGYRFAQMVAWYPGSLRSAESLSTREKVLVSAGLEKDSVIFKSALAVAALTRADLLETRISRFVSYGFTPAEVQEMFRKQPRILRISDKFLKLKMRFLFGYVKLPRNRLIASPNYLLYSLDKRLRPRFLVASLALLHGVAAHEVLWKSTFYSTEKQFLVCVSLWKPDGKRLYHAVKRRLAVCPKVTEELQENEAEEEKQQQQQQQQEPQQHEASSGS